MPMGRNAGLPTPGAAAVSVARASAVARRGSTVRAAMGMGTGTAVPSTYGVPPKCGTGVHTGPWAGGVSVAGGDPVCTANRDFISMTTYGFHVDSV
jgi:hypothetical protein